jgi:XTP/dITP diphosphohydrolase
MRLKFVTSNDNKYREASAIIPHLEWVDKAYTEIQADSLEEVVSHGVKELIDQGLEDFFIEDAGLFIHSLKGFPGVYSSYVNRTIGCEGILRLLGKQKEEEKKEEKRREAEFRSVIGLYSGEITLLKGICKGEISTERKGEDGFGFDPIFIPDGASKTFAEMKIKGKNQYSHRARALEKLKKRIQ